MMLDMSREDLEQFEREDEIVENFKKKLFAYIDNDGFINDISEEDERRYILNGEKTLAYDTGKEEGKKENQLEIAKNLLSMGIDLSKISEATHVTIEELKQLNYQ